MPIWIASAAAGSGPSGAGYELANQGIQQGSEAYNNAKGSFSRGSMISELRHFLPVTKSSRMSLVEGWHLRTLAISTTASNSGG
jgi:hypothetical protein